MKNQMNPTLNKLFMEIKSKTGKADNFSEMRDLYEKATMSHISADDFEKLLSKHSKYRLKMKPEVRKAYLAGKTRF